MKEFLNVTIKTLKKIILSGCTDYIEEFKKIKELKKTFLDDSRIIQFLDGILKNDKKSYLKFICGRMLIILSIVSFCYISVVGLFGNIDIQKLHLFLSISALSFIIAICLFNSNAEAAICNDELLHLNNILKEKTMSSVATYPIIQKDNQCFVEEDGKLVCIGNAKNQTMKECELFSYKEIVDWEDMYGSLNPRYQLFEFGEVKY